MVVAVAVAVAETLAVAVAKTVAMILAAQSPTSIQLHPRELDICAG